MALQPLADAQLAVPAGSTFSQGSGARGGCIGGGGDRGGELGGGGEGGGGLGGGGYGGQSERT